MSCQAWRIGDGIGRSAGSFLGKLKMKMRMVKILIWLIVIAVLALLVYVRLAPSDPERWHQQIKATANETRTDGAIRVISAQADTLTKIDRLMLGLPRTQTLAGSVKEGRITYVTRSALMGFPDYTTIEQDGDRIKISARQRFGKSDLGVNAKRLEGLINTLNAGG